MARHCGNPKCDIPLIGRHVGKARERLVAIIGGVSSGKTSFLLMAVNRIVSHKTSGRFGLNGEIDEPGQEMQYRSAWKDLSSGAAASKTSEVEASLLLYVKKPSKFLLYLYYAPGEEFTTISGMAHQQYLHLLEGIILLVDPYSFETICTELPQTDTQAPPLKETVDSMLVNAIARFQVASGQKIPVKIAVVLSKADLNPVIKCIGDIRQAPIPGDLCRKAVCDWGGESEVIKIEQRFAQVAYFACSAIGREVKSGENASFRGYGMLDPLMWILKKKIS